jgi:hypothetical protein
MTRQIHHKEKTGILFFGKHRGGCGRLCARQKYFLAGFYVFARRFSQFQQLVYQGKKLAGAKAPEIAKNLGRNPPNLVYCQPLLSYRFRRPGKNFKRQDAGFGVDGQVK